MDERQVNRYLRRNLRGPSWFLIAYYILMNLMVLGVLFTDMIGFYLGALAEGDPFAQPDMQVMTGNAVGYLTSVAVVLLILLAWKGGDFWKTQVFTRRKKMNLGLFAIFACLCLASQLVNSFWISGLEWIMNRFDRSVEEILESVSGSSDTVSMFLYASIVAPISEELIFRGYVQRSLERFGRKFSIFCSAFLFGLFHGNLLQTPYAFLVGLVLGYVAAEYHIGWAIGLHMFNNLVLADLLTRVTAPLSEEITGAIHLIIFGLGAVISGIFLVVKRREITDYLYREWMDRRCLKWFFLNSGTIILILMMAVNAAMIMVL